MRACSAWCRGEPQCNVCGVMLCETGMLMQGCGCSVANLYDGAVIRRYFEIIGIYLKMQEDTEQR